MLSKKNKAPLRKLPTFFTTAYRAHGKSISLFAVPGSTTTKCSIIISKKTAPTAVQRNTLKRLYYEQLKKIWEQLTCDETPLVVVVVIRSISPDISQEALAQLGKICKQLASR